MYLFVPLNNIFNVLWTNRLCSCFTACTIFQGLFMGRLFCLLLTSKEYHKMMMICIKINLYHFEFYNLGLLQVKNQSLYISSSSSSSLPTTCSFVQTYTSFNKPLLWVPLKPCFRWIWVLRRAVVDFSSRDKILEYIIFEVDNYFDLEDCLKREIFIFVSLHLSLW